ncbi:MAG TPA: hypothetical protein VJ821_05625 [Anaerolineales bacterium]|nr:hypothetical protein [Anaerolineales bacterium]
MDNETRTEFLKDEYLHIQNVIEDLDSRAITIKAWSITFSSIAIIGAFTSHTPMVLLIAGLSSILFWLLETLWKTFQDGYYARAADIESFFAGTKEDLVPFQIARSWKYSGYRRMLGILIYPHVALPHAVVLVIGLTLYVSHRLGLLQL